MLVILVAWALLRAAALAGASGTAIPMDFYTDNVCTEPSKTAANVTLNLDVCTVTPGLGSYILDPFPCSSGLVVAYAFSDTACGHVYYDIFGGNQNCYYPSSGDLAAILLSCNKQTPGQPSSTTTINVGAIATAAAPTSPAASSTSNSGSGNGSASTGSSGSGSGAGSTGSSSPTSTSSSSPASAGSSSPASGWDSLDPGTRIGIIVALAVGIPPILIGLAALQLQRKKKARKAKDLARALGTPLQTYSSPYQSPYAHTDSHSYFHR